MKKLLLIILTITLLFSLSSCDYLNAGITLVKGQIPSFESGLPDLLSGTYKKLTASGNFFEKAIILSNDNSFKWIQDLNQADKIIKGLYSVQYSVFTETQMAGTISLQPQVEYNLTGETYNKSFVLTFNKKTGKATLVLAGVEYLYTGIPEKVE